MKLVRFAILAVLFSSTIAMAASFTPMFSSTASDQIRTYNMGHVFVNVSTPITAITSLKVRLNVTYDQIGQLTLLIKAPGRAEQVVLNLSNGVNLTNTVFWDGSPIAMNAGASPFTGFYNTGGNLNFLFNGVNPNGIWEIKLSTGTYYSGTFHLAELEFNNNVLPVEMTSFTAVGADHQVMLRWRTETEINNAHFNLYRSTTADATGELLTQVTGHGTSSTPNEYSFEDTRVINGTTYYYRIADVSLDGIEKMSRFVINATPAVKALGEIPIKYNLAQNYPNPFNPSTSITYSIHETGLVKLSVFNETGQSVAELVNGIHTPNTYKVEFNATGLPTGNYFYTLSTRNFTTTKKMILTK